MASSLRVNAIVPASGTNVAIGTAGGTITYAASVSGVSTFSSGIIVSAGTTSAPSISPSGDSNTGMFFPAADTVCIGEGGTEVIRVDSSGNVGIGSTIPQTKFDVGGAAYIRESLTLGRVDSTSEGGQISFNRSTDNATAWSIDVYGNTSTPSLRFIDGTASSVRMSIDGSGRVTMPYQPAFSVAKTDNGDQIASGVYVFNQVHLNRGGHYNTSTGRFTAPVAGAYYFVASLQLFGAGAAYCRFQKNGADLFTGGTSGPVYEDGPDSHETVTFAAVIDLAIGDYVTVERNATTRGMQSSFSGYLIG